MTLKEKLIELNACEEAYEWAYDKTIEEVWNTCHRGDWMLWLFRRTNPNDLKLLMLAKGHCANTVRHLMKDERSIKAVDAAISFGNGELPEKELSAAAAASATAAASAYSAYSAYSASATASASAASAYSAYSAYSASATASASAASAASAYSAYSASASASASATASAAAYSAASAASAASATASAYSATAAAYSAKKNNQMLTADICRKFLPCPII